MRRDIFFIFNLPIEAGLRLRLFRHPLGFNKPHRSIAGAIADVVALTAAKRNTVKVHLKNKLFAVLVLLGKRH